MVYGKFLRLPPNKEKYEYSLSNKKNKEVEANRRYLAEKQEELTDRKKVERSASAHGGYVSWRGEERKERVIPMTRAEYEKVDAKIMKIGEKLTAVRKTFKEAKEEEIIPYVSAYDIADAIKGKSSKEGYGRDIVVKGNKIVEEKIKDPSPYSLLKANELLRGLDKLADRYMKIAKRIEKKKTAVAA